MTDFTMTSRSSSWLSACSAASARSSVVMAGSSACRPRTVKRRWWQAAYPALQPDCPDRDRLALAVAPHRDRVAHARGRLRADVVVLGVPRAAAGGVSLVARTGGGGVLAVLHRAGRSLAGGGRLRRSPGTAA